MLDETKRSDRVRAMFDGIARRYDLLNHLLSLNLDRRWRRTAARELASLDLDVVLDLCGGTGDLSLELERTTKAEQIVCCDFSHSMLEVAGKKFRRMLLQKRCVLLEADALRLPFQESSIAAVTVAFGVRNFAGLSSGFREILRVLRPGGRMVVLEFSRADSPFLSWLYKLYLQQILPRIGDGISGRRGPYGYLARTIGEFPDPAGLADLIRESGFAACGWETLNGGIVAIHTAIK